MKNLQLMFLILLLSFTISGQARALDGAKVFKRCMACHTVDGKNKIGPSLLGVVGRAAGTVKGFKYSKAMKESGIVWTEENLDQYLTNSRTFIPKNKMVFAGLKKAEERKAVIDYIASFK
ncbi:MAG: cytochrome c family protein [Alphaproteobacteria bacterium]|nr:cytochrome c family protein [Alphaproteobacteria bacterium]